MSPDEARAVAEAVAKAAEFWEVTFGQNERFAKLSAAKKALGKEVDELKVRAQALADEENALRDENNATLRAAVEARIGRRPSDEEFAAVASELRPYAAAVFEKKAG